MTHAAPPIVKLTHSLLRDIELAVAKFPRSHRYGVGEDLRAQMREIARLANRAWRDRPQQAMWVERLVWGVDELKFTLQLGKEVRAFASFRQFEHLARIASNLGQQVGGWHKHPKGQNVATHPTQQRAQTLSTRAASTDEVNS